MPGKQYAAVQRVGPRDFDDYGKTLTPAMQRFSGHGGSCSPHTRVSHVSPFATPQNMTMGYKHEEYVSDEEPTVPRIKQSTLSRDEIDWNGTTPGSTRAGDWSLPSSRSFMWADASHEEQIDEAKLHAASKRHLVSDREFSQHGMGPGSSSSKRRAGQGFAHLRDFEESSGRALSQHLEPKDSMDRGEGKQVMVTPHNSQQPNSAGSSASASKQGKSVFKFGWGSRGDKPRLLSKRF